MDVDYPLDPSFPSPTLFLTLYLYAFYSYTSCLQALAIYKHSSLISSIHNHDHYLSLLLLLCIFLLSLDSLGTLGTPPPPQSTRRPQCVCQQPWDHQRSKGIPEYRRRYGQRRLIDWLDWLSRLIDWLIDWFSWLLHAFVDWLVEWWVNSLSSHYLWRATSWSGDIDIYKDRLVRPCIYLPLLPLLPIYLCIQCEYTLGLHVTTMCNNHDINC